MHYLVLFICLIACSKEKPEEPKQDLPPNSFTVAVSNVSPQSAQLAWTASADPEGAAVRYSLVLGNDTLIRKQDLLSYSLTGLTENMAYSGSVIAYDPAGQSAKAEFSFSTGSHPAPSDFTITQVTGSVRNDVSWTAATLAGSGTVSYDVYLDNQLAAANQTALTYSFTGLNSLTAYAGKIVAKSSYGKSTEKTFAFTTLDNQPPSAPVVTLEDYGFRYARLRFSAAVDPEGGAVSYSVVVNNVDVTANVEGTIAPGNIILVGGLAQTTSYSIEVKARDAAGKEVRSAPAQFRTYANPPNPINDLQVTVQNGTFTLSWSKQTEAPFSRVLVSDRFLDKDWQPVQTSFSGGRYYYTYNMSVLPVNKTSQLMVKVEWGYNGHYTYSNEVVVSNYTSFSPTTVKVKTATIGRGFKDYRITFENALISEYTDWDLEDVVLENYKMHNLLALLGATPNTGYVTGNVTDAQFADLVNKSRGWVIIKDAGGYHKHEFTYTIVP
jgi:hypothetical protein